MKWIIHNQTRDPMLNKNFKQMNKKFVPITGGKSSINYRTFRESNVSYNKMVKGKAFIEYILPDENFTYGKRVIPEAPITYLIGNMYGLQSEISLEKTYY